MKYYAKIGLVIICVLAVVGACGWFAAKIIKSEQTIVKSENKQTQNINQSSTVTPKKSAKKSNYETVLEQFKKTYKHCYAIELRGYGGNKYGVKTKVIYATEYQYKEHGHLFLTDNGKEIIITPPYLLVELSPEEYVSDNLKRLQEEFQIK